MNYYRKQLTTLFKRLGVVLIIYFLSRVLFVLFNHQLFPVKNPNQWLILFLAGMRFDISAVFMTNGFFILASLIPFKNNFSKGHQQFLAWLFFPANILAIIANLSDIIYVRFTLKRTTLDFLSMFQDDSGLFKLLPRFLLNFWYLFIIGLVFIWSLFWIFYKKSTCKEVPVFQHSKYYLKESLTGLFLIGVTIIGIRGGFELRPISILTGSEYLYPEMAPVILNTPFTLIKSAGKQRLKAYHFFTRKETDKIYYSLHKAIKNKKFRPLNVVVIIMESLSKEHIGFLNRDVPSYHGFTPFLDSLFSQGMICTQAYANGKTSMQGIPAVTAGCPSLLENPFITSIYSSNELSSLASLLKKKHYFTTFFHGGNNGTMGFDQFTKSVGFDAYYGRNEYGNDDDYDGKWGIFDEPYFQYFGRKLNTLKQPFLATIFSLSAHHPYTIPPQHKGEFRKGKLPIQECIMYSDYALRKFFHYAKRQVWYDNTLFVITADHCSEVAMDKYNTCWGKYAIPIFYFMPADSLHGEYKRTTQQIDILPSILDYLHYDQDYLALGESVFDSAAFRFAISYFNYNYQLIHGKQCFQSDLKMKFTCGTVPGDSASQKELQPKQLNNFLKAFVQTFNERMLENKMRLNDHQ